MPCLLELRGSLRPGGRLIVVHYLDPSCLLQRSMRLLYKAYYDPRMMSGVRVVTVQSRSETLNLDRADVLRDPKLRFMHPNLARR
jgi:hypothetical protein